MSFVCPLLLLVARIVSFANCTRSNVRKYSCDRFHEHIYIRQFIKLMQCNFYLNKIVIQVLRKYNVEC